MDNPAFDEYASAASATSDGSTGSTTSATATTSTTSGTATSAATASTTSTTSESASGSVSSGSSTSTTGFDGPCDQRSVDWLVRVHGSGSQHLENVAIAEDGDVGVLGTFNGALRIGDQEVATESLGNDVFIARFSPDGILKWQRTYGGVGSQTGEGVAFDSQGNLVFVLNNGGSVAFGNDTKTKQGMAPDSVVARVDPSGELLSAWALSSADWAVLYDVAVAPDGGLLIAGAFNDTLSADVGWSEVGIGNRSAFIAKLDGAGERVWLRRSEGPGTSVAYGVDVSGAGEVVFTGFFVDGAITIAGTLLAVANGDGDNAFVARVDKDNAPVGVEAFGGAGSQRATEAVYDPNGNYVVAGEFVQALGGTDLVTESGKVDAFIYKTDVADMNSSWGTVAGAADAEHSEALAAAADASLAWGADFAGAFAVGECDVASDNPAFFIVESDPAGLITWAQGYSAAPGDAGVENLAFDGDASLVAVGWHTDALTIGGETLPGPADAKDDSFLVRFAALP
ncbi:MAG: hypothetical protein KC486_12325 [Myxococcales bacterium]|nr:hypothetical protein [Myxococcales bacterium]